ncbi:MAG: YdeI/OmpD-associated family protein [Gemmatimonadaceae bacterium]
MATKDKRVDAYIAKSAEFARPILTRIREQVHDGCPDCEETLKWGSPTFMSGGSILCIMAAFKAHCMVRFWKGSQIRNEDGERVDTSWGEEARYRDVSDLPTKKAFMAVVKKAVELNTPGAKAAAIPPVKKAKPPIPMPPAFAAALKKNAKAKKAFEAFPPGHKREYLEWIADAKRDETRDKRIAQALDWISSGKPRNWKYM